MLVTDIWNAAINIIDRGIQCLLVASNALAGKIVQNIADANADRRS